MGYEFQPHQRAGEIGDIDVLGKFCGLDILNLATACQGLYDRHRKCRHLDELAKVRPAYYRLVAIYP